MSHSEDLDARAESLRLLLEEKYRMRARSLRRAVRKAGRRLPRRHRKALEALIEAQKTAQHPKLAVQIDRKQIFRGCDAAEAYLGTVDPELARRNRLLDLAALVAFYLLAVLIAFLTWLWWRGYV